MKSHECITPLKNVDFEVIVPDINEPGQDHWSCVMSHLDHHFILVLVKQVKCYGHHHFFATVQLIGTKKQAEKFVYWLFIEKEERLVMWEATPRSIHEGVSSAITNSDCLVFAVEHFADKGKLRIRVIISSV
jgi:E3 ubiquitin-protein ligase SIAH1